MNYTLGLLQYQQVLLTTDWAISPAPKIFSFGAQDGAQGLSRNNQVLNHSIIASALKKKKINKKTDWGTHVTWSQDLLSSLYGSSARVDMQTNETEDSSERDWHMWMITWQQRCQDQYEEGVFFRIGVRGTGYVFGVGGGGRRWGINIEPFLLHT